MLFNAAGDFLSKACIFLLDRNKRCNPVYREKTSDFYAKGENYSLSHGTRIALRMGYPYADRIVSKTRGLC